MKRLAAVIAASTFFSIISVAGTPPAAQAAATEIKADRMLLTATAVVKGVDLKKRTITVQRTDDLVFTMDVDIKVKLKEVKLGDMVDVTYYASVTVIPKGEEGAAKGSRQGDVTLKATITGIDNNGRWVTLREPQGKSLTVKVSNPEHLARLRSGKAKVGDEVEITYSRAVAVAVERIGKGEKK